jgi:hypothetical protein
MTKKHFQDMAINFGYAMRDMSVDELVGANTIVHSFMYIARKANPRFNHDTFILWVAQVRDRERDLMGKLVKG